MCLNHLLTISAENDWGQAGVNITQVGTFKKAPYKFKLTPLPLVEPIVKLGAGVGRIW
jgi:pectate lyase